MKDIFTFNIIFPWLIILLMGACSTSKKTLSVSSETNWFPLEMGNYWVYTDSIWKNDVFIKASVDTIRVIKIFDYNEFDAFLLSNKTIFYAKGDSIYQIHKEESGRDESSLAYYRSDRSSFQCSIDGDRVFQRTVSRSNGNYLYTDECESTTIIEPMVGIRETIFQNCNVTNIVKRKRNLISYQLK